MIKLQQDSKKLTALQAAPAGLLSARHDLKEYVFNSPSEFFRRNRQRLFLIAKDVEVCSREKTSIDLLALDEQGQAVVILLAKGQDAAILARAKLWERNGIDVTCVRIYSCLDPETRAQ